ncbi:probable fibronectin type-III domain-containing protein 3a [Coccomyxa sp. Obi]|nr:probable fibronectin type-III domain-containing protein 3a [Coccomyxa sp. Obi]
MAKPSDSASHVDGKEEKATANGTPSADQDETPAELPPPVPKFEAARPPELLAVDTTSLHLQWPSVCQLPLVVPIGSSSDAGDDLAAFPTCEVEYSLESRLESSSRGPRSTAQEPWKICYRGKDTIKKVLDLRPGRKYEFRIVLYPIVQPPYAQPPSQPPSPIVAFLTAATVPGVPPPPSSSRIERTALVVRIKEPEENGGWEIIEYQLQMSPPPGPKTEAHSEGFVEVFKGIPKDMKHRVPQLQPNTQYTFRVKAFNKLGESEWSEEAKFRTHATVPDQPEAPRLVSAGPTRVVLHWDAPIDNGAPIENYLLERGEGDEGKFEEVYKGLLPLVDVSGLRSGFRYRFRLRAFNRVGVSVPSEVAHVKTPNTTALAPGVPKVIGSNRASVSLSWTPPEDDGGSPVTKYEVEMEPKSKAAIDGGMDKEYVTVYQGEAAACTVSGLRAGCIYRVRVRARNDSGYSPYSQPTDVGTAADVPGQPSAPAAASRTAHTLSVTWEPPAHDGGSPVLSYRLELCRVGPTEGWNCGASKGKQKREEVFSSVLLEDGGLGCHADIDSLDPGNEYLLRVIANNSLGSSPASAVGRVCTKAAPPVPPDPPQMGMQAATANALQLAWSEPWGNGAPITSYTLEMAPADALVSQSQDPFTPPQECAGDQESVSASSGGQVAAGYAASSAASSVDGEEGASTSDQAVRPPRRRGGRRGDAFNHVYSGPDTSCTVQSLDPFTEYAFRLRASNSAGRSGWSSLVCLRTASGPPSVPVSLTADGSSCSSIVAGWGEPEQDYGAPITCYQVDCSAVSQRQRSAPSWQRAWSGTSTSCEVEGLRPGREYMVRVRACNCRGQGPWSRIASAETLPAPPDAPPAPTVGQRTAYSLRLRWDAPAEDNGAAVVHYRLEMAEEGREWAEAWRGASTVAKVGDLAAGRQYSFRVAASSAVGEGPFSRPTAARTLLQPPQPPHCLSLQPTQEPLGLVVRWELPERSATHADAASHEVEACAESGHSSRQTASGKALECTFTILHPGTPYQVRARSVGVDGAGHSAWSEPASMVTPGERALPAPAVAANGAAAAELSDGAQPKRRRNKKPAVERELALADPKLKAREKKAALSRKQVEQLRSKRAPLIPKKLWKAIMRTLMYVLIGFAIVAILTVAYREENLRRQATELARMRENEHKQAKAQAQREEKQKAQEVRQKAAEREKVQRIKEWQDIVMMKRAEARDTPGHPLRDDPFAYLPAHINIDNFRFD